MEAMNNIKNIWLEQEASSGKNVVKRRVNSIVGLNCFIGLIGFTGARMFQMQIDNQIFVHKNYIRKFRGVEIQTIPVNHSISEYTIILLEKDLTDIFTMFIEDIIENLLQITEPQLALTIINQRINFWKKLFSKATGEILSAEKQRGLYGELFFLKLLLQNTSNPCAVLHAWRGSESSNQDFARNKNAVEIKTTRANNLSVHISNEQQLDFNSWDHLFLGLISVNETSGSQNSLAAIINELQEIVMHETQLIHVFKTKLENAGIFSDMIENYNDISYSVSNRRFYRVQDGFPVILKENLQHEAIYNVKYQIDISSCAPFELHEEDVLKAII